MACLFSKDWTSVCKAVALEGSFGVATGVGCSVVGWAGEI
jgi:hypothetical protein